MYGFTQGSDEYDSESDGADRYGSDDENEGTAVIDEVGFSGTAASDGQENTPSAFMVVLEVRLASTYVQWL